MAASRVLVIDDSTTLRKVVEIAMRGTGCEVELAASGHDGIALARKRRPDAILLDYLLPDLPSAEICRRLAGDPSVAGVPVIIMSASQRGVLDDFRRFPFVIGFIGKPFTAPEIRGRLEAAIRHGAGPGAATPSAAARVEPARDSGGHAREVAQIPASGECGDGDLLLRGDLAGTPLMEVLRLLAAAYATGTLVIDQPPHTLRISLRRGEILLASTTQEDGSLADVLAAEARLDSRDDTRSETRPGPIELVPELRQRVSRNLALGKPVLVTLAEAGVTRAGSLPLDLHAVSARLIAELLDARSGRFVWEPAAVLPEFVEAFGRHVSLTALALEHARRANGEVPTELVLDRIYDRTPRFSQKIAGARLDGAEQRVLSLVDGRSSGREIVVRAGVVPDRVAQVLVRLCAADLIAHGEISHIVAVRTVAVLDPDGDELVAPLRAQLRGGSQAFEVIELDPSRPVAVTTLEAHADVVLIGASKLTAHVIDHELPIIAREGTVAVVCVLDAPNTALATRMLQSGLHAVIAKPVHVTELERLLSVT